MNTFQVHDQATRESSPWSFGMRVRVLLWELCWTVFCSWTPKPLNRWRLFWLRAFGARLRGVPFVHARASIIRPWNLTMHERSCIGDGAVAYCLDRIELGINATLAQESYICTGTHDFDDPRAPLKTAPISIGADAFIGLRAIVLPGVVVGAGGLIGAGAVVTRDTDEWTVYGGNPARRIGTRRRAPTSA
jgi:putative colanic acid biosynthesis acetyltransferase WcaF